MLLTLYLFDNSYEVTFVKRIKETILFPCLVTEFCYDGIWKEPCIESPAFGQTLIRGLGTTG